MYTLALIGMGVGIGLAVFQIVRGKEEYRPLAVVQLIGLVLASMWVLGNKPPKEHGVSLSHPEVKPLAVPPDFEYGVPFKGTVAEVVMRDDFGVQIIKVKRGEDAPRGLQVLDAVIDPRVKIKKGDRVEVEWLTYHAPNPLNPRSDILRALEARKIEEEE